MALIGIMLPRPSARSSTIGEGEGVATTTAAQISHRQFEVTPVFRASPILFLSLASALILVGMNGGDLQIDLTPN
jgi:hypothetical protein